MQEFKQLQKVLELSDREIAAFAKSKNADVKAKLLLTKSLPDKHWPVTVRDSLGRQFWLHTMSFIDAITEISDVQYVIDWLEIPEQLKIPLLEIPE